MDVLLVVNVLHFLNDGIRTAFVTLLPFVAKELQLTYTQVGMLGASQGLLATLLAIPMGIITSKVGGVRLIFTALLIYSLCALLAGLAPGFVLLFIAFYLAGASFAPFHLVGQTLIARSSTRTNIGRNLGNFTAIGESGRVFIPAIMLLLIVSLGWRNTYLVIAGLGLVCFVILLWVLRNKKHIFASPHEKKNVETIKEWMQQMFVMLRQKKLVLIIIGGVIDNLGSNAVYVFLPFLLLARGVSSEMLAVFMGIFFLGCLVGKKYLGHGVDRYGNVRTFIFAEYMMAVLIVLLVLNYNLVVLFIISFILGLFTRGTNPVISTLFSTVSHEDHYEKVYTIGEIFLGIGAVVSPLLLGFIADRYGLSSAFYVSAGFAVLATVPIYLFSKIK